MSGGIGSVGAARDDGVGDVDEVAEVHSPDADAAAETPAGASGAAAAPRPSSMGTHVAALEAALRAREASAASALGSPRAQLDGLFEQAKRALGAPRLAPGAGTNEKGYKILTREQQIAGDASNTVASQIDASTRMDFEFVKTQIAKGRNAVNIFGSADGHVFGLEEEGTVSKLMHDHSDLMAQTAVVHDFLTATLEPGTSGVDLMPVAAKIARAYGQAGGGEAGWQVVNEMLYDVLRDPDHYKIQNWVKHGLG